MTDYTSLKVPELKKLLQEKSLSATGNKADLIARLKEYDDAQGGAKPAGGAEDEIDWDDDEPSKPAAPAEPAAAPEAASAPIASEDSNPDAEAGQAVETTNAETANAELSEEQPATAEAAAPKTDFSAGLAASSVDEEARKRADRAKRFGITPVEQTAEEKAKAERASRFGIEQTEQSSIVKGLDAALPERRERKRGREGAETTATGGDRGAKRQQPAQQASVGRNDRNRGRNGRRGGGGGDASNANGTKNGNKKASVLSDPSEKAKAEARAKRFA